MKITFYRLALSSNDKEYKSKLGSYIYPNTVSESQALADAKKQFQEQNNITDWNKLASFYEIE